MNDEFLPLPHAPGVEKAVLSVALRNPERIDDIPHGVELFHLRPHRLLFEEMAALGPALEPSTLLQRLHDKGKLEDIGGAAFLAEVVTYAPVDLHFESHISKLIGRLARRMGIAASRSALETLFDCSEDDDSQTIAEALTGPFQRALDVAAGLKPIPTVADLSREFRENYRALYEGRKIPMGIPTGIFEIDDAIRGLHLGHMGVISAFSEGGKSTLASQILSNVGSDGTPVAYFPMEGTMDAHFQRCVIQLSKLPALSITAPDGKPSEGEFRSIKRALEFLESGNFHFEKPSSRHVASVLAGIRRSVRKHGTRVAVVDYLQLMRGQRQKGDSGEREFADISHAIQELADSLGIAIIVLSQQNADGETKHARAIEEDCDFWLSIVQHRDRESEDFKRHKHVLLAKDRHNGRGGEILPLILDREHVRFVRGTWALEKKKGRFASN